MTTRRTSAITLAARTSVGEIVTPVVVSMRSMFRSRFDPKPGSSAGELTFDESFVGVQSDEQVEDRARRDPVGRCQCRGTEDRAEGVEASLGVGAR